MDKEERKEYLRYRVWLFNHAPEHLKTNTVRKGYREIPNREYMEVLPCRECRQPFQRDFPWQRRCDNCIKSEVLDGIIPSNEYRVTSLEEVFNGKTLKTADVPGGRENGDAGKRVIYVARTGSKRCKKCGGSIFQPTYGCDGCYSYKEIYRANSG